MLGMRLHRLEAPETTAVGDDPQRCAHHAVDEGAEVLAMPVAYQLPGLGELALDELQMPRAAVLVHREPDRHRLLPVAVRAQWPHVDIYLLLSPSQPVGREHDTQ